MTAEGGGIKTHPTIDIVVALTARHKVVALNLFEFVGTEKIQIALLRALDRFWQLTRPSDWSVKIQFILSIFKRG
jgi:hypothetical protein